VPESGLEGRAAEDRWRRWLEQGEAVAPVATGGGVGGGGGGTEEEEGWGRFFIEQKEEDDNVCSWAPTHDLPPLRRLVHTTHVGV
jgi:hypothetical protein